MAAGCPLLLLGRVVSWFGKGLRFMHCLRYLPVRFKRSLGAVGILGWATFLSNKSNG